MHYVTHPQFSRLLESESPTVLVGGLTDLPVHEPMTAQEPVDCGRSQVDVVTQNTRDSGPFDHGSYGERRALFLDLAEQISNLLWNGASASDVGSHLRTQRRKSSAAVGLQPVSDRLRRHPRAARARNVVHPLRLLSQQDGESLLLPVLVEEIGNQSISEKPDLFSCLVVEGHVAPLCRQKCRARS